MKKLILGILYCTLWYISILVGFFVFICPLLPLVFIHPRLYRRWSETVFGMWEPFPVALMEIFFGLRAVLTGDQIDPFERSLLIMNHRTRLDWNFLWVGLFHCTHPYSHALKYVLKAAVMHFPGPGWVMQTCSFLFVYRNWAKDQKLLERLIQYLDTSDEPYQILIFPEGTDLTTNNLQKSHRFADDHNLERYYNVLHPKTTGFAFIAHKMKLSGKINAVYDITIGYPGEAPQNETDLLKGNIPEEVHFHVKRYGACDLPFEESDLKKWLNEIWRQKELILSTFHRNRTFQHLEDFDKDIHRNPEAIEKHIPENSKSLNNIADSSSKSQLNNVIGEMRNEEVPEKSSSAASLRSLESTTPNNENFPDRNMRYCGSDSSVNRNRPSHLLYLTFWFWLILIYITIHQFFFNYYVRLWVIVHALLFSMISFLSRGFQHIIASIYFYRCNVNEDITKRNE